MENLKEEWPALEKRFRAGDLQAEEFMTFLIRFLDAVDRELDAKNAEIAKLQAQIADLRSYHEETIIQFCTVHGHMATTIARAALGDAKAQGIIDEIRRDRAAKGK